MHSDHNYWFPAKRYGWGWGLPISWQGWIVLIAYFTLMTAGIYLFPPSKALGSFLVYITVLSGLLIAVCWVKGEPLYWRWSNH